ncbi:SIR2 family NAD-dependent protein deacylase [Pseudarthrobacter raffinosi]|uniref:SIR2 family NAD-dependent protein deacylase n=1 Tax=Pseudarthrobacter raffinosi TaxID=2953651 RepID=UPI00208FB581|nr:SIR2 family protein [Pseudarthrobacter sp. MDT3-9]MCO4251218.1 SIR2 family protein [Pseudarthrobacter sp. MDT3-9]
MADYRERLIAKLTGGKVIAVVGAGVSAALTARAPTAAWLGLIEDGIERAASFAPNPNWKNLRLDALTTAVEYSDTNELIAVATSVSDMLKESRQGYADWLRESVGELPLKHTELAKALDALRVPLFTTNYDTLLSRALKKRFVTWKSTEQMRSVFNGDSMDVVGHLHGVWDDPDSVILSATDYKKLTLTENAQFLQHSQYASKSFLFIGCGDTVDDPNFTTMLRLHRQMFPESKGDHFRLSRNSEVAALEKKHVDDDIRVVSYGSKYEDLAQFLGQLAESAQGPSKLERRVDTVAYARESLLDRVRTSSVTLRSNEAGEKSLEHYVVPPLLLPMSHEQFASMQSSKDRDKRPRPLDPHAVARGTKSRVLVVVGDEHSGVTTALQWLLAMNAQTAGDRSPIYIDAKKCSREAKQPFIRSLRREAMGLRLIDTLEGDLPIFSVALDNVTYREDASFLKIMDDLASVSSEFTLIGCKPSDESFIVRALEERDVTVSIVHMGKLSKNEVSKFASLIAPMAHVETTCDAVLEIAKREHLPRNPFTISLLISLISELGQRDERYDSETTVLDEYTKLLLGMFGERIDARFALTYKNKETILARLAKEYVLARKGSLRGSRVLACIEDTFDALSWKEDPEQCLLGFYKSRVLRRDSDQISFQQSSYLYLFAAKAAISDQAFREHIFEDPLFFSPVIRHFAALKGDSSEAVQRMLELLDDWDNYEASGRIFGDIEVAEYKEGSEKQDEFDLDEGRPAEKEKEVGSTKHDAASKVTPYDTSDDADMVPFPVDDLSNLSESALLARRIDLASRVLRDSDDLADKELKSKALQKVLHSWSVLIELVEQEADFAALLHMIIENDETLKNMSEEKKEEAAQRANLLLPTFYVMAAMNSCLTSRKLLITHDNLVAEEGFADQVFAPVGAALFALLMHEENWSTGLQSLLEKNGSRWIVSGFIALMAQMIHKTETMPKDDEQRVKEFIIGSEVRKRTFNSVAQKKTYIANLGQRLDRTRKLNRRERLELGESAASNIVAG